MKEIRVATWTELHERLWDESWQEPLGRFRSNFAFRGVPESSHALESGLGRGGDVSFAKHEHHLLRNFRKYARHDLVPGDSIWNWLALAQHHGMPTRLLDWTYSPYVALHFVTEDVERYGEDGVIWCVDYVRTNDHLPERLKGILRDEGSHVFTAEMLERGASTLREFDGLAPTPFVVFFEPPSIDERLVNQFALFSLMSSPRAALQEWLQRHPELCRRIVVPAELKWEVRDKLDQANITERVLYPGLDGLSRWLRRYYAPKPG